MTAVRHYDLHLNGDPGATLCGRRTEDVAIQITIADWPGNGFRRPCPDCAGLHNREIVVQPSSEWKTRILHCRTCRHAKPSATVATPDDLAQASRCAFCFPNDEVDR